MPHELLYTPIQELKTTSDMHPQTFVMMVDPTMYQRYKQGETSVPLSEVMDSFEVFKYDKPGHSGTLSKPSHRELQDVFGTSKEDSVAMTMIEKGTLRAKKRAS